MTAPATTADFKAQFDREFIFGPGREHVRDSDIVRAFADAEPLYNAGLWDAAEGKTAFLYCAAHMLKMNVEAAGGLSDKPTNRGLDSPGNIGIIQSKSVGNMTVNYALPDDVVNDTILGQFTRSGFGLRYLALFLPRSRAAGFVVGGWNDVDQ